MPRFYCNEARMLYDVMRSHFVTGPGPGRLMCEVSGLYEWWECVLAEGGQRDQEKREEGSGEANQLLWEVLCRLGWTPQRGNWGIGTIPGLAEWWDERQGVERQRDQKKRQDALRESARSKLTLEEWKALGLD